MKLKFVLPLLLTSLIFLNSSGQTGILRNDSIVVSMNGSNLDLAWAGGLNSTNFNQIDLNHDGNMDLHVFDRIAGRSYTFVFNTISSEYEYAPEYQEYFPDLIEWVVLRDFNCDNKPDIFTRGSVGFRVFENTTPVGGNPSFELYENALYGDWNGGQTNVYCSAVDYPGVDDIDGDGDIDILAFGNGSNSITYWKNMAVEQGVGCDTLIYVAKNLCWGGFSEDNSTNGINLNDNTVYCGPYNFTNPEFDLEDLKELENYAQRGHAGSSIMVYDDNGDGIMDLVLGDVAYGNLVMLTNSGTAPNMDNHMVSFDIAFPSNTVSTDIFIYPGAFYVDVDNDGLKDLITTTVSPNKVEDKNAVWRYKNVGTNSNPVFTFQENDFLQGEMLEVGTGARPILFDFNGDGLEDLFVANTSSYINATGNHTSTLYLFENVGTASTPEFEFVTDDYESLSQIGLPNSLHPAFGDLDNDGDKDMLIGDQNGNLHYFQNISTGAVADFVLASANYQDADANVIDVNNHATPFLEDMDRDGDLDLLIGNQEGYIVYYQNRGDATSPSFELASSQWGGVEVLDGTSFYGYAVPWVNEENGEYRLYVGSQSGNVWVYDSLENDLDGTFHLTDSSFLDVNIGPESAITIADLTNDGEFEYIFGNQRGGLDFYQSYVAIDGLDEDALLDFSIYPNPSHDFLMLELPYRYDLLTVSVCSLDGKLIRNEKLSSVQNHKLDVSQLSAGMYLIVIESTGIKNTKRFIVE